MATVEKTSRMDDRLVRALAQIEEAEENLRTARELIRVLFQEHVEADDA
jgi:hypothetical protein